MNILLICPADRPKVPLLAESGPLALVPVLGKALIEYWIEHLVTLGVQRVLILAVDRPEQVRALVGKGERWGIFAEVLPVARELTPVEAQARYPEPDQAIVMDHLPGAPHAPLFESYAHWAEALMAWMPQAAMFNRIGVRALSPGVWVGLNTRISPRAELRAPCWVGDQVTIGPEAVIGPGAIVENRAWVDRNAAIYASIVGPDTYVGKLTEVSHSLAWGRALINWKSDSCIKVHEAFLLCALNQPRSAVPPGRWLARLAALLVLVLMLPAVLLAWLRAIWQGRPTLRPQVATRAQAGAPPLPGDILVYYEWAGAEGWWRRWPQLWNVVCGQFTWVGNRPLSPQFAAKLANEFERRWLDAPIGLLSLADVEGCGEDFNDETRAHASFYAAEANWRLDAYVLTRALLVLAGRGRGRSGAATPVFTLSRALLKGERVGMRRSTS